MDQTPHSERPDAAERTTACAGEPTERPRKPRVRWLVLVLAHVAIGLSTGLLAAWIGFSPSGSNMVVAVSIGIVFGQTSLLGIWAALGTSSWWKRLPGVVVGMVCLGLLLDLSVGTPYLNNQVIVLLATVLVAGVLLVVRCFSFRICVTAVDRTAVPRFQFSIRHLLILTFVVACLVSLGKWLGPHLIPATEPFRLAMIGLLLATVGLMTVWSVLGRRHPLLPSMIATGVAAGLGFGLATWFHALAGMTVLWTTIPSVEALSLVASLLVLRSCGYRLVRLPVANSRVEHGATRPGATS
jgi:hypothetical protein